MIKEIAAKAQSLGIPWQTLLKEALQGFFLETFFAMKESSAVTFQGGTCLRLVYGGPRHSEDLDFVTLEPLENFEKLRPGLAEKFKARGAGAQGSLELTAQKSFHKILRWKLKWSPSDGEGSVFVRVELAAYPAHTRELKPLLQGPAGVWIIVPVESKEEILTDKLAAIAGRPYLKGRDFFDLWFLDSQGVAFRADLLRQKLKDYNTTLEGLLERGRQADEALLRRDLSPFLPAAIRQRLEDDSYREVLRAARAVISRALRELSP
ncbi:MAG: hypothetical protein A3J74_02295 [Elusimicrobia bacterium RIFCSPHIGHO2_02_FULL_57_9]|nr:MAG: hypothetical protein A3J74_02295 [Elusimicrobia bacterium RIFCSPHIGHO2_02_FULL_57_9]